MHTDDGQAGRPGRRRGSRLLFWYVMREFLLPLVCCLLGFSALFFFNSVLDDLPDFMRRPLAATPGKRWEVGLYFLLLQPGNMLNVLPMSVLLASSFMVSLMAKHHELSAMRAAGIRMSRMALPVWIVAALLCGVSFAIGEWVVPACSKQAQQIREDWTETKERLRRQAKLVYHCRETRRDWFFEAFAASGSHEGVFIKQFTTEDAIEWELRAATASYRGGIWKFENCEVVPFDPNSQLPIESAIRRETVCWRPDLTETPDRIVNHVRPVEELSVRGIWATLRANPDLPGHVEASLRGTAWFRLSFSLACLVGALFGVGLSITRERGSAMRGFAYAVGLMVAFYVISQLGLVLARKGHGPPVFGGCLPTLAFLVAGMAIVYRQR